MTISKRYRQSVKVPPVRLRLEDLRGLANVALDAGLTTTRFATQFGVTRVTASSLDEFINDASDFPDELSSLVIEGFDAEREFNSARSVILRADRSEVMIKIEDTDESRLLGKEALIRDFLHQRRAWYGYGSIYRVIGILGPFLSILFPAIAFGIIFWLLTPNPKDHGLHWYYPIRDLMLLIGSLSLAFGTAYLFWRTSGVDQIIPHFVLDVRRTHRPFTVANLSAVASILGLFLALGALFVAH